MASPASIVKLPSRGGAQPQPEPLPPVAEAAYNPLLPYWAVLETDIGQVFYSWVYRLWVLVMVAAATGFLLYRVGVYKVTGVVQHASHFLADLTQWTVLVSVALVAVLSASSISGERGSLADSVLSRGISRFQYYMGKWHGRLLAILGTHFMLGLVGLAAAKMFLHEDLHISGGLAALGISGAMLAVVVSIGVMVSALVPNSFVSIAVLWVILYGGGMLLSSLPDGAHSPEWTLEQLPFVLRGQFHMEILKKVVGWALGASLVSAIIGVTQFSRRDM